MANQATKPSLFTQVINGIHHLLRSGKNFVKSSFISLVVIAIILLLLTQMDQAFTMMIDLIESHWISLFLAFFFINGLAIVLSHYPIYTYYAADLNNSGDYTEWHTVTPLKFWPFKYFPVYIFTTNKKSTYKKDNWANYLRYLIGLLIHGVWIHFIISSFKRNIIFETLNLDLMISIIYILLIVPFVVYVLLKERIAKLERKKNKAGQPLTAVTIHEQNFKLKRIYKRLSITYFFVAFLSFLFLIITLFVGNFSPGGFVLLLVTSYLFMFNYVFFRLLRTKLTKALKTLTSPALLAVNIFISRLLFLEKSQNYILLFNLNFLVAALLIFYSTLASINGWGLHNGIPILLAFFYFYYFIIASLGKYFFVARKINLYETRRYRAIFISCTVLVLLFIISNIANIEVTTHELDLVENTKTEISEKRFIDSLKGKDDNTLFFIASHGGGLKANVWTLNVVNTLQKQTHGKLLNQTIAMSGASGGSLGLALYTGLYRDHGTNTSEIQQKIDLLAHQNYTSLDLSLTFGLDSYRKLWPLSERIGLRDRPYYAMRKYQNIIQTEKSSDLSNTSFRDYWREAFNKTKYFPSLIMNTAGTKGSRGILWSVKQNHFSDVFPYAENLADLSNNKTIPFYQAVSTTNRFPVFSPAAKIRGHGHFIDAGAIDNSGLLGCLDLHNYLMKDPTVLGNKQIAYIEIINSKSLYVNYLLDQFQKENNIRHIEKNENETDNIIADLQVGLNLDKIPGYLSDYITIWENAQNGKIRYFKIFMPHKVSMDDVNAFFSGNILDASIEKKLRDFLTEENNKILSITEKPEKSFFDPWEFYEPTLSRHLSRSSNKYIKAILKHDLLTKQFMEIETLINTKVIKENESAETAF